MPFIVSGRRREHNFSVSEGTQDDLLPWVIGGVLLIAATIAVAAVVGSGPADPAAAFSGRDLAAANAAPAKQPE